MPELTSAGDVETINLAGAFAEKELSPGRPRLFATPRVTPVNTDLLDRPSDSERAGRNLDGKA